MTLAPPERKAIEDHHPAADHQWPCFTAHYSESDGVIHHPHTCDTRRALDDADERIAAAEAILHAADDRIDDLEKALAAAERDAEALAEALEGLMRWHGTDIGDAIALMKAGADALAAHRTEGKG